MVAAMLRLYALRIAVVISILWFAPLSFGDVEFPSPKGFVNDYAGVLTPSQAQTLESISESLKKSNGSELAVVVVQSVEPLDSKRYAVELFETWGIGEKGKDNGVLLLLAMKERRVEIEVGYGMEGALTDAQCGRILDAYAVPRFKQGDMGGGLIATAEALAKTMGGETLDLPASADEKAWWSVFLICLKVAAGVIVMIFGFIFVIRQKATWISSTLFALTGAAFGSLSGIWWVIVISACVGSLFGLLWAIAGKSPGGGGSSSSSSSWSSSSSSGGSSFGGFSGGSSGGGGAGRGW